MSPSVGRIVLYVLPDGPNKGAVRPAIVATTFTREGGFRLSVMKADERDFVVSHKDRDEPVAGCLAGHERTSPVALVGPVWYDETGIKPGTWHWPPRA